jgi:hypothetical protein
MTSSTSTMTSSTSTMASLTSTMTSATSKIILPEPKKFIRKTYIEPTLTSKSTSKSISPTLEPIKIPKNDNDFDKMYNNQEKISLLPLKNQDNMINAELFYNDINKSFNSHFQSSRSPSPIQRLSSRSPSPPRRLSPRRPSPPGRVSSRSPSPPRCVSSRSPSPSRRLFSRHSSPLILTNNTKLQELTNENEEYLEKNSIKRELFPEEPHKRRSSRHFQNHSPNRYHYSRSPHPQRDNGLNDCEYTSCSNLAITGKRFCCADHYRKSRCLRKEIIKTDTWTIGDKHACFTANCTNQTNLQYCTECFAKYKNEFHQCYIQGCIIMTRHNYCFDCYNNINQIKCANIGCSKTGRFKYCDTCYRNYKSGITPKHTCKNNNCEQLTKIHLKYCDDCYEGYKNVHGDPNEHSMQPQQPLNIAF